MAGTDHRMTSCDATIGEAAAEAVNDDRGLEAFAERTKPPRCPPATRPRLQQFVRTYRAQAQQTLRALTSLANSLAAVPGRRVIVLVSEGLYFDTDIVQELPAFGAALERSRVVLYAIHLDFPLSRGVCTVRPFRHPFPRRPLWLRRHGQRVVLRAAGAAIRAISPRDARHHANRSELSGTYLLGIERLPTDVAGKSLELKVDVSRKGTDVRSRQQRHDLEVDQAQSSDASSR
jgi:hypothetical protein